jgi:hypothetical protein
MKPGEGTTGYGIGFSGPFAGTALVAAAALAAGAPTEAADGVPAVCAELEELLAQPLRAKRAPVERHAPIANGRIRC